MSSRYYFCNDSCN